ncbi:glycosyltransferase, partial [Desulfobacterota bacterium AH_259_B03_O07]|nr:glycosyltransferase [Desulfobacterota bacterium AH_259_B03_O07]
MNVLHIIPSISLHYGGPSKAVVELCAALQQLGVNTTIATTNAAGEYDLAVPLGRKVDVNRVSVYYFPRQFFRKPVMSLPLINWLKYNVTHYDILHIHGVFSIPASAAAVWARRSSTPYVIRPCGTLSEWSLSKKPALKKLHLALVGRGNLNGAAALHATSEG